MQTHPMPPIGGKMGKIEITFTKGTPPSFQWILDKAARWYFTKYHLNEDHRVRIGFEEFEDDYDFRETKFFTGGHYAPAHAKEPAEISLNEVFLKGDSVELLFSFFHELSHYKVKPGQIIQEDFREQEMANLFAELGSLDRYERLNEERHCNDTGRIAVKNFIKEEKRTLKEFIKACGTSYLPYEFVGDIAKKEWL